MQISSIPFSAKKAPKKVPEKVKTTHRNGDSPPSKPGERFKALRMLAQRAGFTPGKPPDSNVETNPWLTSGLVTKHPTLPGSSRQYGITTYHYNGSTI